MVAWALAESLERAAAGLARLDQALASHPLRPAFLYRVRLDAVRRQAGVDGLAIDPWHLAALLEGLKLRMDGALRIIDRGAIFEAARHALVLHQWLTAPSDDQEAAIRDAAGSLAAHGAPLLSAGLGAQAWLAQGGARAPLRAALVRHWTCHHLLHDVPLTGVRAFGPDAPAGEAWVADFLDALAGEAADALHLLTEMDRVWRAARAAVAGRRSTSHAAAAIDAMAAAPLVSATSLAAGLNLSVKSAGTLLDGFVCRGLAIEVTHRAKRRLFGLVGLAPLRDAVAPPRRPLPGRKPGRPPLRPPPPPPPEPLPPVPRLAPPVAWDTADLDRWMAQADRAIAATRRTLADLMR